MDRCLVLARKGAGLVAPNPMVGAVIVHEGVCIGEGFHHRFGGPHAEVLAIDRVRDPELLRRARLYVNLEPCSHHGKTPPCVDRILECGIPRVVVGQKDPNPKVAGRGIRALRNAGVDVLEGVRERRALDLNRRFNTYHTAHRPYIVLKWAQTADGIMDLNRHTERHDGIFWISRPATKKWVHSLRSRESAILVGAATAQNDNPRLDTREFAGKSPLRVVLEGNITLSNDLRLFNDGQPTLLFQYPGMRNVGGKETERFEVPAGEDMISHALNSLYDKKIVSVLVEGGMWTLQRFIDAGLWDEAYVIQSSRILSAGRKAPRLPIPPIRTLAYGRDTIHHFKK